MFDLIRDSAFGNLLNSLSGGRILPFADQRQDYVIPERYLSPSSSRSGQTTRRGTPVPSEKEGKGEIGGDAESILDDRTQEVVMGSDVEKGAVRVEKPEATEPFLVDWDENDPDDPR